MGVSTLYIKMVTNNLSRNAVFATVGLIDTGPERLSGLVWISRLVNTKLQLSNMGLRIHQNAAANGNYPTENNYITLQKQGTGSDIAVKSQNRCYISNHQCQLGGLDAHILYRQKL